MVSLDVFSNAMGLFCAHFVCGSSTMNPTRQQTWSFMKNSMILLLVFAISIMSAHIDPGVFLFAWHWFTDKVLAKAYVLRPKHPSGMEVCLLQFKT